MATTTTPTTNNKALLYVIGGLAALFFGMLLLVVLFYGLSFLSVNLFLSLDASLPGRLTATAWPGYALLGLGVGAAAGAVAAQRRFRLSKAIVAGAAALVVAVLALAAVGNRAHFAAPPLAAEAAYYAPSAGQGQCPACATIETGSTYSDAGNRYTAANLLDKNPATAWISDEADKQQLTLTLSIPADQRLVGLRIGNGYGKSQAVFNSFSRVRTCRIRLDDGPETYWQLPDTREQDSFIPLTTAVTADVLHFTVDEVYAGENHSEVAISGLTPVIERRAQ